MREGLKAVRFPPFIIKIATMINLAELSNNNPVFLRRYYIVIMYMHKKIKLLLFCLGIIVVSLDATGQGNGNGNGGGQSGNPEPYVSKDNYTGIWNDGGTWNNWDGSSYTLSNPVEIDGFVESNESLFFDYKGDALVVRDTLIVYGDLSFATQNSLVIEEGGLLIVYGNLVNDGNIEISPQGYLVVQGDLDLTGAADVADGDVGNIFVGGENDRKNFDGANPDSIIGDIDPSLGDFYEGNELFSIHPDTTEICSQDNQSLALRLAGGNKADAIDSWQKSTNPSDENSWNKVDESNSTSYTVPADALPNEGEALYYRVQYTVDGTTYISDTAVVYCGSLCTITASINEPDPTACYAANVSFGFTSTVTDGTPDTYKWEITSADDSNVGNIITQPDDASDQITYSNFPNPEAVSWNYTVTLTVTDAEGCESSATRQITLQRRPETGNAYYVPNDFDQQ